MPFLRFSRDKRGYENTYVMHAARKRGRARSRILYWFRTPPSVRVGRAALDEEAIRQIEEHNPSLSFDWERILKAQPLPAPVPNEGEPRKRTHRGDRPQARPQPRAGAPVRRAPAKPPESLPEPAAVEVSAETPEPSSESAPELAAASAEVERMSAPEPVAAPQPVAALLGAEGLARLRGRYAELLARIGDRVTDPVQQQALRAEAERLNPDTWVTQEEAETGAAGFDAAFHALRARLGGRRRRSRRGGARRSRRRRERAETEASPVPSSEEPEAPKR